MTRNSASPTRATDAPSCCSHSSYLSTGVNGCHWVSSINTCHSVNMCHWVSLSVTECHWVSLSITEWTECIVHHWVSLSALSVSECHWVHRVPPSVTECQQCHHMSLNVTECHHMSQCHWVSASVTKCHQVSSGVNESRDKCRYWYQSIQAPHGNSIKLSNDNSRKQDLQCEYRVSSIEHNSGMVRNQRNDGIDPAPVLTPVVSPHTAWSTATS